MLLKVVAGINFPRIRITYQGVNVVVYIISGCVIYVYANVNDIIKSIKSA